jgi:Ni/Co efflux regulator RcnB
MFQYLYWGFLIFGRHSVKRILSFILLAVAPAVYMSAQQTAPQAQSALPATAGNGQPQTSNAASSHDRHHRRHRSRHHRHHPHSASQH